MANLEFCDKHNMVAYLKKPTGSEGFQEIVDFLNGSHIRYALTKNPTIYVSLIEKFWQTATVRTVDNGEQEITATVDGKEFTITEASVRRHLQLADVDGISVLPTTKIFDQLSLMGNMKRGFSGEHTPLFPSMLAIQAEEGEGSGHPSEPQPPPSPAQPTNEEPIPNVVSSSHQKTQAPRQALNQVTELPQTSEPIPNVPDEAIYEEWDDRVERATTTAASLYAEQASEELDEEERQRMARVHAATQSFTEEEWENIKARVEADKELTQRLQVKERNKYSEVDQAKMLVDLINQRKSYFVAQKAKAKRNKPMTQITGNYYVNYIKHMGSHTLQQLKRYSFDELKELFETTMKNVNAFILMETEDRERASKLAAGGSQATITDSAKVGSSKRATEVGLDHEGSKKQKDNEASDSVQELSDEEEKELPQEDLQ
ncbi:hypothetical protein Tco_1327503 [Tanacetum coccineum]